MATVSMNTEFTERSFARTATSAPMRSSPIKSTLTWRDLDGATDYVGCEKIGEALYDETRLTTFMSATD